MRTRVEVFSAHCPCCETALRVVKELAGIGDEVIVVNKLEPSAQRRAKELGVARVPSVAVDGRLASCCSGGAADPVILRAMGVGR